MSDPADESIDGRIREILAGNKACRSEREMKASRAIWQASRDGAVEECAREADVFQLTPKLSPSEQSVMRAFAHHLRALLPTKEDAAT